VTTYDGIILYLFTKEVSSVLLSFPLLNHLLDFTGDLLRLDRGFWPLHDLTNAFTTWNGILRNLLLLLLGLGMLQVT